VRRLKIDRRGAVVIERRFPARNTNAPAITGLQTGKTPFRMRRDQVVSIEHGKIQKLACGLHADGVLTDIFGSGPAKSVTIKSCHRIATAAFQFRSQHICRHKMIAVLWLGPIRFGRNGRFTRALLQCLLDRAPGQHRAFDPLRKSPHALHQSKIAQLLRRCGGFASY